MSKGKEKSKKDNEESENESSSHDDNNNNKNTKSKDNDKDSNNNNGSKSKNNLKRDRKSRDSDSEDDRPITWAKTQIQELSRKDIDVLLDNRWEENDEKVDGSKKDDYVKHLIKYYKVEDIDIDQLTVKQIMPELRLRGYSDEMNKKSVLVARLKGEREDLVAPPKKKAKKTKARGQKVFVALFQPPVDSGDDDASEEETQMLGVCYEEELAWKKCVDAMLNTLKKNSDKQFTAAKTIVTENDKKQKRQKEDSQKVYEKVRNKALKVWNDNTVPYCWVENNFVE